MCVCVCVCEQDLALNNLLGLICHKIQSTNFFESVNSDYMLFLREIKLKQKL